jgi:hypothetical protein
VRALEYMILSFKVYLALRTQMSIRSSGTNVFLSGAGVEPAMETFGAENLFERIQSEESGFQGAQVHGVPNFIGPFVPVLQVLTVFDLLYSRA